MSGKAGVVPVLLSPLYMASPNLQPQFHKHNVVTTDQYNGGSSLPAMEVDLQVLGKSWNVWTYLSHEFSQERMQLINLRVVSYSDFGQAPPLSYPEVFQVSVHSLM